MIRKLHPDARVTNLHIQNIVASSAFPGAVDVESMAKKLVVSSLYTPELFPGLRLKLHEPKMKALVFLKGRVVLTGGRTREDVRKAWSIVRRRVSPFIVADGDTFTHAAVTANRQALRKMRIIEDELLTNALCPLNHVIHT